MVIVVVASNSADWELSGVEAGAVGRSVRPLMSATVGTATVVAALAGTVVKSLRPSSSKDPGLNSRDGRRKGGNPSQSDRGEFARGSTDAGHAHDAPIDWRTGQT